MHKTITFASQKNYHNSAEMFIVYLSLTQAMNMSNGFIGISSGTNQLVVAPPDGGAVVVDGVSFTGILV
jgi:hypothetical protein